MRARGRLPDPGRFDEAERTLDAARLDRILRTLANQRVSLALPKFRVESLFWLRAPLTERGLTHAFLRQADFSGISSEPGFAIDDVIRKTFVDVNEEGTEAAAVTMPVLVGARARRQERIIEFTVDRPFMFAIRDAPTNTILFLGRVVDPR